MPSGRDIPWGLAVPNLLEAQHHQGLPEIPEGKRGVKAGLVTGNGNDLDWANSEKMAGLGSKVTTLPGARDWAG